MESEFVNWLRPRAPRSPALLLGIGDDAALLAMQTQRCVVTSDMLMDEVDFYLDLADPRRVGRKALAVNLSDLAAMAARPVAAIVSIAIPVGFATETLEAIYEGIFDLAREFEVAIAGGDTNSWDHPLAISVTALGEPTQRGVVARRGAAPGDAIMVTGSFGGSILGRHFDFQPRVAEALLLHERYDLRAMIDVSDGLSLDLSRLASASGCGAIIDLEAVPISPNAIEMTKDARETNSALEHALADGEDFELIFAVSPEQADQIESEQPLNISITRIGELISDCGLWQRVSDGRVPLEPEGYEHQ
jgi:thiamine-monophosphate kinase